MTYALIAIAIALALLIAYRKGVFWAREPAGWYAGPIFEGKSGSPNVKAEGNGFKFPVNKDGIHYFTKARGPINGLKLRVTGTIEAAPDVKFVGVEDGAPATMSVYIQRENIDWQGGFSRWCCPLEYRYDLKAGPFDITVPLTSVMWMGATDQTSETAPAEFMATLAQPGRVGVVFGGNAGRGHGVYATGEARLVNLEWSVV
jgi:hypothetical protein